VLFIALIVLVAMSLAGVALMRSVDTGTVVAGNMAFKQAAIMVADRGTQEAVKWLSDNSGGTTLQMTNTSKGYFSSRPPGAEPDWFRPDSWTESVAVNGGTPDASGNVVRYVIHRMCTQPDAAYNATAPANECAMYFPTGSGTTGGSMAASVVAWASCCSSRRTDTRNGIITMAPPPRAFIDVTARRLARIAG